MSAGKLLYLQPSSDQLVVFGWKYIVFITTSHQIAHCKIGFKKKTKDFV